MNNITAKRYRIFFGTAQESCDPSLIKGMLSKEIPHEPFGMIRDWLGAKELFFLHQTHSADGLILEHSAQAQQPLLVQEGDYLITNQPHLALGILTADCLPIVLYDSCNRVMSVVHAGWRGSIQHIAVKALHAMGDRFGTTAGSVEVFFGPAARACCYEIKDDVIDLIGKARDVPGVIQKREQKFFLDTVFLNTYYLMQHGVPQSALHAEYSICTMCSDGYHSFRKEKTHLRHITAVSLHC